MERVGDWMVTYSGQKFWPLDPRADEMRIVDVAHHLAMMPRFGGACKSHYSVAEHCVIGSHLVQPEFAFEFLMHDAEETWAPDMINPIKHHSVAGERYSVIGQGIDRVVRMKWNLPACQSSAIKRIDAALCEVEKRQVFQIYPGELDPMVLPDMRLHFWKWQKAEAKFLERFMELTAPQTVGGRRNWWRGWFTEGVETPPAGWPLTHGGQA